MHGRKGKFCLGLVSILNVAVALHCALRPTQGLEPAETATHQAQATSRTRLSNRSVALSLAPPVLTSTYLGGAGFEIAWSCAVDKTGSVYVGGDAQAADFPVTS